MSYCRERGRVDDTFFYGYSACTQKYLKNTVIPELLTGAIRSFQPEACR
jgi:hypothetical protein